MASKREESEAKERRYTAKGIASIAVSIYLLFCITSSTTSPAWTGYLGFYVIKWLLEKIAGIGVFLLPILLAFAGFSMLTKQKPKALKVRKWGFILFFLSFISAAQIFFPIYYPDAKYLWIKGGGGVIGYLIVIALNKLVGTAGVYIGLSSVLIISVILMFNVTTTDAFFDFIGSFRNRKKTPQVRRRVNIEGPNIENDFDDDRNSIKSQLPLIKDINKVAISEKTINPRDLIPQEDRPIKKYRKSSYKLPPLDLLNTPTEKERQRAARLREITEQRKIDLERALHSFGVEAHVVNISIGPAVTRFEVQPEPGVKVSKIASLSDDIALNLASGGVRIEAPILGKSVVGIEVPNSAITPVHLGEIARTQEFGQNASKLFIGIGKDIAGTPIYGDLSKMPHLLIAGTTGSGKSVAINSLITSILLRARPDEVKIIMIDPKMVELAVYSDIPHLMAPLVTDPRKAAATLKDWVIREMERRYKAFFDAGVRNIDAYNKKVRGASDDIDEEMHEKFPYIVVIIDELADLMMVAASEVETAICRVAQLARATGIHLVVATQRPSVDVITGLIKANIPSRISFAVATQIDSRVVLDISGAEKLLGRGDMLYSPIGAMKPIRVQGSFVSDDEIERIVGFIKKQASPEYSEEILNLKFNGEKGKSANGQRDELFAEAARIIIEGGQASTSHLQRRMRIGYNRAARLMDELTDAGVVSIPEGENKPRRILMGISDLVTKGLIDKESKSEYPVF